MAKEIKFPKRQNVTFYERDKELYHQILKLADKDGRSVEAYIRHLLHSVVPTKLEQGSVPSFSNKEESSTIQEPTTNSNNGASATREKLLGKLNN